MEPESTNAEKQRAIQQVAREMEIAPGLLSARSLANPFFRSWTLWRVEDDATPPLVAFVATRGTDVKRLKLEEGFAPLVASEPVRLASNDDVLRYLELLLSVSKPMVDVLEGVGQVPGISEAHRAAWKDRIVPPAVRAAGNGHQVDAWLLDEGNLVQARFDIDARGQVKSDLKVAAPKIGVSIIIE
jgi:hypothetical protein